MSSDWSMGATHKLSLLATTDSNSRTPHAISWDLTAVHLLPLPNPALSAPSCILFLGEFVADSRGHTFFDTLPTKRDGVSSPWTWAVLGLFWPTYYSGRDPARLGLVFKRTEKLKASWDYTEKERNPAKHSLLVLSLQHQACEWVQLPSEYIRTVNFMRSRTTQPNSTHTLAPYYCEIRQNGYVFWSH